MFTGIVQGIAFVSKLEFKNTNLYYSIQLPGALQDNIQVGASIAVDGVCQTVVSYDDGIVSFVAIAETLAKTALRGLQQGQKVNVERSLRFGDEVGGHLLSGHVMGTGTLLETIDRDGSREWRIETPKLLGKYCFTKGYIGLDGASITIVSADRGSFTVSLIPHTLEVTTFKDKQVGCHLNIEVDTTTQVIVDTVERYMASHTSESKG